MAQPRSVPPQQPAAPQQPVAPQTSPQPAPAAPTRRTPWLVAAALIGVLAVIGVVIAVTNSGGDRAAAPTTATDTPSEEPTTTTTTVSTTAQSEVVVGHPKQVTEAVDCPELLKPAEIGNVLGASVTAVADKPCYFDVNYPGEDPGELRIDISSVYYGGTKLDHRGNTAYQDDQPIDYIDTEGGGGTAPNCEVSIAVTSDYFLRVSLHVYRDSAPDLCETTWRLVDSAFDELPDA